MLVLGTNKLVDWRNTTLENIEEKIKEVKKEEGVLVGIAHPFAIGNPVCTGCRWEYQINDYNLIDYIEIYNSPNPLDNDYNEKAYEFWVSLINQGYRLSCVSGRDWHGPNKEGVSIALTYIGVNELNEKNVLQSLKKGNNYITLGPLFTYRISDDSNNYYLGDEFISGNYMLSIEILETALDSLQHLSITCEKLVVLNNEKTILTTASLTIDTTISIEKGTLRFEVVGLFQGEKNTRLITTSPCWII